MKHYPSQIGRKAQLAAAAYEEAAVTPGMSVAIVNGLAVMTTEDGAPTAAELEHFVASADRLIAACQQTELRVAA